MAHWLCSSFERQPPVAPFYPSAFGAAKIQNKSLLHKAYALPPPPKGSSQGSGGENPSGIRTVLALGIPIGIMVGLYIYIEKPDFVINGPKGAFKP